MHITLSISDVAERRLYLALIRKCDCSLINSLQSVCFVHNDDSENYRTTNIYINDRAKNTYGEISCGITSIDEVSDSDEYLTCLFLDYISDIEDKPILNQIIDETSVSEILISLIELIQEINQKLIKDIDHITQ